MGLLNELEPPVFHVYDVPFDNDWLVEGFRLADTPYSVQLAHAYLQSFFRATIHAVIIVVRNYECKYFLGL